MKDAPEQLYTAVLTDKRLLEIEEKQTELRHSCKVMKTYTDLFRFGTESYTTEELTPSVKKALIERGKKCTSVVFNVEFTDGVLTDKRIVY